MSEKQFDNGYWYATEIKDFAKTLGVQNTNKLRKDELEKEIKYFLKHGKLNKKSGRPISKSGEKDLDKGLRLNLQIVNYTSNKETKDFLHREALKKQPNLKKKSGSRYRLNRWREEQIRKGKKITYGDLVNQYIKLNQTKEPFKKIAVGRYINFLADYLKYEKDATHQDARKAWGELKKLDIPKDYKSWKKFKKNKI